MKTRNLSINLAMRNMLLGILVFLFYFPASAQKRLLQFLKQDTGYTIIKGVERENKLIHLPRELNCGTGFNSYIVKLGILYEQVDGSGMLYKIDSTGVPFRMDNTCYEGYNFGAYNFTANNKFYSLGGWGFWQYNGALRFFDDSSKEWLVTNLNKDVPFSQFLNGMVYNDYQDDLLYIIYKPSPNTYIQNQEKYINDTLSVQCLDLKTFQFWDKPRKLDKGLVNYSLFRNTNFQNISTSKGLLVANQNGFTLIDFKNSKSYILKNESVERFVTQIQPKWFMISRDSSLYVYNPDKDSVELADISFKDFKLNGNALYYDEPKPSLVSLSSIIYWLVILLITAISILIYFNQRSKIKKLDAQILKKNGSNGNKNKDANINNATQFQDILTPQEKLLFELILKNSKQDKFTSIDEINLLLGVKNKESSIQNKVRSEKLQIINQRFKAFTSSSDELIERERTEFDKRFYHYKINRRYINRV